MSTTAAAAARLFPLRWESTGDQWWFASPIDWAAANGHYDVVRELLHIDPNLLIKLTSLPRIKRLETVWDDLENPSNKIAQSRSSVAKNLYRECDTKEGGNSLIKAGYGGWLLYTAASAGDLAFVRELLDTDTTLVFGEREYGVTDIFYAAARSRCCEVFKAVFDCSVSFRESAPVFTWEMRNRAVHSLARGGNVELLKDFLMDFGGDVLSFRDAQGSSVLHSAAGTGQVEVVRHLITSYDDIIASTDDQGNTSLHIAAYRGHLPIFNLLIASSPSLASSTNKYGDTVLHMAVLGFSAPTFRRLDQQLNLVDRMIKGGNFSNVEDIINVQNEDGRTPLHLAVMGNVQSDVVELLMSARYIDLNILDRNGKTPLAILKQKPYSASSEILIKRLISAGGKLSDCGDQIAREALVSCLKIRGIRVSPGTSFKIPDAEIFLYAGIEDFDPSNYTGEIELRSRRRFNLLLLRRTGKEDEGDNSEDDCSVESYSRNAVVPLRQQFLGHGASSLSNNKRVQGFVPSPTTKTKFAEGLRQGVLRALTRSPSRTFSESTLSSCLSSPRYVGKTNSAEVARSCDQSPDVGKFDEKDRRHGSLNLRLMNNYFCFGSHGLRLQKGGPMDIESPPMSPNDEQGRQW